MTICLRWRLVTRLLGLPLLAECVDRGGDPDRGSGQSKVTKFSGVPAYYPFKGKTLEFTSQPYNGKSFSFSGNFKRVGDFPMEQPEDKDILYGSLRVFKNKILLRQHLMKLRYEAGD